MEEKVVTSGQTAPGNEEKKQKFDINSLSKEELVNIVTQMNQQLQMSNRRINELEAQLGNIDFTWTRLNFLFKVLENRNAFGDPDYIITVCDEIRDIMTIKDEQKPEEKQN